MNYQQQLTNKLNNKTAKIAVLGLGYVGLPLAVVFAEAGFEVTGIDPIQEKVDTVNRGESHISDIPAEVIERLSSQGLLKATTDYSVLSEIDAVSICVPTPLRKTGDPDLSYILTSTDQLVEYMHPGMVIVLESTSYPGTTREILLPKLSEKEGLSIGKNFFLAFSPERVDPGRKDWTTYNTPKVIGGITTQCTEIAALWYSKALDTIQPVSSTEVAEMTKLLENTFRMINIGLVNEMAMMCDRLDIDIWEVIDAASTKPFGFMKFTPGPGLGGHCIPIDPLYLSWKLKGLHYTARFIELASEINTGMPRYVVGKVQDILNSSGKPLKDSSVLVLGAAYKSDIDDYRESPALDVIVLLQQKGVKVSYHDMFVPEINQDTLNMKSITSHPEEFYNLIRESDLVIIITNHSSYDYDRIVREAKLIYDTRNALGKAGKENPKVFRL